jgi:LysM repeat protein
VWRPLVALLGTILVAVGGATPAADPPVRLTIETHTGSVTSVLVPTDGTLECERGARGTGFLEHVAAGACALVRKGVLTAVATEHRQTRLCTEVNGGPQRAQISGTVGRRRVAFSISRSDGCGIDDWNRLRSLLGDPERSGAIPRRRPRPVATTSAPPTTYHVQSGDTLTDIAKRFHTSIAAIAAVNQIADPDHLAQGQALVMPPPSAARIDLKVMEAGVVTTVGLTLVGAQPSELVTFVVTLPDGTTYTGSPHAASSDGTVTATYAAELGLGTYAVSATGTAGTDLQTAFHLDPPG